MANPAKRKGTTFEVAVRDFINERLKGHVKAYRVAQGGVRDVGDIHGVSPFIIQAKAWKDLVSALREGVAGAVLQAKEAGETWGVAVIKRARKPVGDAYAVMRLSDFVDFYGEYLQLRRDVAYLRRRLDEQE